MLFDAEQPQIIVIGSSSIDLVINTEKFPKPNETVLATKTESFFGGKGANQAVGTSRLGASVYFVGSVGMDPLGQQVLRNLVDEGVNVGFVYESEDFPTGTAYVTATNGDNSILVVPAANHDIRKSQIDDMEKYFLTTDLILLQLEIPMHIVEYTVRLAKKNNVPVGIYAAPGVRLSAEVISYAEFIIVKKDELTDVFGVENTDNLMGQFPNKLFIRDESNSTSYFDGAEMKYFQNDTSSIVHKMGMGDAFTSGFAIAYCHKNSIDDCVKFGNLVSLKVAENRGSQRGLPYLKDFE